MANSVEVIVASPPYNKGVDYNSYYDNLSIDEYLGWIESMGVEIKRV